MIGDARDVKEFWIHTDSNEYASQPGWCDEGRRLEIHVIEYAAYENLLKDKENLKRIVEIVRTDLSNILAGIEPSHSLVEMQNMAEEAMYDR